MKKFFYIAVAFVSIAGNCATPATKPYVDSLVLATKNEARSYTDSSVSNAYAELDKKIDEYSSVIYKDDSILIGHGAGTEGGINVVVGGEASATGMASVAVGYGAKVNGNSPVAIGSSSIATNDGAIAIGSGANASHAGSVTIGQGASSNGDNTFSVSIPFDKWYAGGESVVGFLTNEVEDVFSEWVLSSIVTDTSDMYVIETREDDHYEYTLSRQGWNAVLSEKPLEYAYFIPVITGISGVTARRTKISSRNLGIVLSGEDAIHVMKDSDGHLTAISFGRPYGLFGEYAISSGIRTESSGRCSHAEGVMTVASGRSSHAEGEQSVASGMVAHAEGGNTVASGDSSHAEGGGTVASGMLSHAEGANTVASGDFSHAEGVSTVASGFCSKACGSYSEATNDICFVWSGKDWSSAAGFHNYSSHGHGTFNINPLLGIEGFFVGEKNLKTIIEDVAPGGGGGNPLAGQTFDFSDNRVLYTALSNIVIRLGGSVTNFPDFN